MGRDLLAAAATWVASARAAERADAELRRDRSGSRDAAAARLLLARESEEEARVGFHLALRDAGWAPPATVAAELVVVDGADRFLAQGDAADGDLHDGAQDEVAVLPVAPRLARTA